MPCSPRNGSARPTSGTTTVSSIDAVTSEAVTAFAKKYLAQPISLIIVGKAAEFAKPLRKNFPNAKLIEEKNLDLNAASLTK